MREGRDIVRQIVVAASAVIAIIGSFVGSGAAGGTPIQEAAGGALSATSTPVAPDVPAFGIWSVIYLGLVAYAVWQFLPKQSSAERHRRLGYWIAASLLLNAAWILSVQYDLLPLSLPIIAVLLAVLGWTFALCLKYRPTGRLDAVITDGTIGLYLGWVSIATAAATAIIGRGRIAPALSLAWGLAWVAVGRLSGELISMPAAVAAIIAVVVVLGSAVALRLTTGKTLAA